MGSQVRPHKRHSRKRSASGILLKIKERFRTSRNDKERQAAALLMTS